MDSLTSSQKMIVMGKQVTEHSSSFMVNSMFTAWFSRDKEVILPGFVIFKPHVLGEIA